MADGAVVADVSDMGFMREECAIRPVHILVRERSRIQLLLCVAHHAAGLLRRFLIAAVWRMADVAFGMRGDFQHGGFCRLHMAEVAIGLLPGRQVVGHMHFVLFGVEECIEIIALRKITLRRAGGQPLFRVVTDGAGLRRFGRELLNVTFDAGFVTGKLQFQLFVTAGRWHQLFHQVALIVAGIAFQIVRLVRAGHFDHAGMRLVGKLFVIRRGG